MSFDLLLLSQSGSDRICFIPLYAPGRYAPPGAGTMLLAGNGELQLIAAMSEKKNHPLGRPQAQTPARSGKAGAREEGGGGHPSFFRLGCRAAETGNEQLPTNKLQAGE